MSPESTYQMKAKSSLPNLILIVALALSGVAAYYSIIGLTAIFAGATVSVIIMGVILEVAKLTITVWLRNYWTKCGWVLKSYLVPSVLALALITSMGIFGYLSRAHIIQGVGSGDVADNISLIDEKIKTQRDNIAASRSALAQMDLQVNTVILKGDTEKSAERSVRIRRQQASERSTLQTEIASANEIIKKLNEERAPIASQMLKVEAEVGPIKYIAAMIYGDQLDSNFLEKAVRWVILLLVAVFDPLAIAMLIAANQSRAWEQDNEKQSNDTESPVQVNSNPDIPCSDDTKFNIADHPYLFTPPGGFKNTEPIQVFHPVGPEETPTVTVPATVPISNTQDEFNELPGGHVSYQGKQMHRDVLKARRPDLFVSSSSNRSINTSFGIAFPSNPCKGDVSKRVDVIPNKVFKFDGINWINVNKEVSTAYLSTPEYIPFLVNKIDAGEYDIELMSEEEKYLIEEYLKH